MFKAGFVVRQKCVKLEDIIYIFYSEIIYLDLRLIYILYGRGQMLWLLSGLYSGADM